MAKKIKITQIKSSIGYRQRTKDTLVALGLKKMNCSVVHSDNPAIRGMLGYVNHLVRIEDVA
tara:strand:+ start:3281 stop:3466 length:186 start_codon:yes stop_codon:yes gene_type:complete